MVRRTREYTRYVLNFIQSILRNESAVASQTVRKGYFLRPPHIPGSMRVRQAATGHDDRPSGFVPLPFPALRPLVFAVLPLLEPSPAMPRGLPAVATRGPPTPTASFTLLP